MEIGSLAEWIEGLGELLAVSVALFLPYYQKHKTNKENNQRAKQVIIGTTQALFKQDKIQSSPNYDELKKFVAIYSVLAINEKTINIIEFGNDILEIIDDHNQLDKNQITSIQEKIVQIQNIKP